MIRHGLFQPGTGESNMATSAAPPQVTGTAVDGTYLRVNVGITHIGNLPATVTIAKGVAHLTFIEDQWKLFGQDQQANLTTQTVGFSLPGGFAVNFKLPSNPSNFVPGIGTPAQLPEVGPTNVIWGVRSFTSFDGSELILSGGELFFTIPTAKKVKPQFAFKTIADIVVLTSPGDAIVVQNGAFSGGAESIVALIETDTGVLQGLGAAVEYKPGVNDPFDGKSANMWTVTLNATPDLLKAIEQFDSVQDVRALDKNGSTIKKGFGAKNRFALVMPMPKGTYSLGLQDDIGGPFIQILSIFYKRVGKRQVVFQGRAAPPPGKVPLWAEVKSF